MRLMTSKGLAAKRRVKPPSSATKRRLATSSRGMYSDAGREGAAVAEADHGILALFAGEAQVTGAEHAERAQRQGRVVEVGRDLAEAEPVGAAELLLELHAMGDLAVDEDPHHALAPGPGDEAVRLDIGDVEPGRDLALRQAADVVEPGGAGREARLVLAEEGRLGLLVQRTRPAENFSLCENFHLAAGPSSDFPGPRRRRAAAAAPSRPAGAGGEDGRRGRVTPSNICRRACRSRRRCRPSSPGRRSPRRARCRRRPWRAPARSRARRA